MASTAIDISGCILVPIERLRALEALEAELPTLLAKAKAERDKEKLEALHAARKANPQEYSKKVLEKYHKNKDEINARRREAYKLKKEAQKTESAAGTPA
jgi:hypothetical protein